MSDLLRVSVAEHRALSTHVLTGLGSRALSQSIAAAAVVPSALGPLAQLHGAAELCLAETLADPTARPRG